MGARLPDKVKFVALVAAALLYAWLSFELVSRAPSKFFVGPPHCNPDAPFVMRAGCRPAPPLRGDLPHGWGVDGPKAEP